MFIHDILSSIWLLYPTNTPVIMYKEDYTYLNVSSLYL